MPKPEDISVMDIMSRSVFTVPMDASVEDVLNEIINNKIHAVIVVTNGEFMGVISNSDIIRALAKHKEKIFDLTAEDIMSSKPVTISGTANLKEAAATMIQNKVHRIIIMSPQLGKLIPVGILSSTDIVREIKFAD